MCLGNDGRDYMILHLAKLGETWRNSGETWRNLAKLCRSNVKARFQNKDFAVSFMIFTIFYDFTSC